MNDRQELILQFLQECGVKGNPNGKGELPLNFCMFHEHNFGSPSLQVNINKEMFVCYSCGAKGNIRRIFYHFGIEGAYYGNNVNTHEDFYKAINESLKLFEMPPEEQNNADESELKNYRYLHPYLQKRGYSKELLLKNGVGFNPANARVTIPVRFEGKYYGCIQRTTVNEDIRYVYPKNFQKSALLYEPKPVFVEDDSIELWCEGSLDALKAAQHGYHARAILGCAISTKQLSYLESSRREIVLAFDNDEPGRKAVEDVLSLTGRFDISVLEFPEGVKDVGDLSKEELDSIVKNRKNRLLHLDFSLGVW